MSDPTREPQVDGRLLVMSIDLFEQKRLTALAREQPEAAQRELATLHSAHDRLKADAEIGAKLKKLLPRLDNAFYEWNNAGLGNAVQDILAILQGEDDASPRP